MDILNGFLSFLVPLFIVLAHYWYISLPIIALAIWGYIKTKSPELKRALRIFLALIGLSVIGMAIMLVVG